MIPAWLELLIGFLLAAGGVRKGFFVELDKVGQVPEDARGDMVLAAQWRDAQVTTGCLWVAGGLIFGGIVALHGTGRMVFGW